MELTNNKNSKANQLWESFVLKMVSIKKRRAEILHKADQKHTEKKLRAIRDSLNSKS